MNKVRIYIYIYTRFCIGDKEALTKRRKNVKKIILFFEIIVGQNLLFCY